MLNPKMKKKPNTKAFEAWAMPVLQKLQTVMLLHDHAPLKIELKQKMKALAEFQISYPYKSLHIRYSPDVLEMFEKKEFEELKGVLSHELSHALTDPLYCKATNRYVGKQEIEDERERLTDHIANIVLKNKLI